MGTIGQEKLKRYKIKIYPSFYSDKGKIYHLIFNYCIINNIEDFKMKTGEDYILLKCKMPKNEQANFSLGILRLLQGYSISDIR